MQKVKGSNPREWVQSIDSYLVSHDRRLIAVERGMAEGGAKVSGDLERRVKELEDKLAAITKNLGVELKKIDIPFEVKSVKKEEKKAEAVEEKPEVLP